MFAGTAFRQVSGVPMGGNASPLLADLTLTMLEFECVKSNARVNWLVARFVNDVIVVNCQNFLEIDKEIYPNELELECTFFGNHAEFLDLDILLKDGAFGTTVFNKVDSFPFKVNRFGYPGSCVPLHSHFSVLYSQLVR